MNTIDKIKIMLDAPSSTSIVAYRTFLKDMLAEAEKYRWHDLRKDLEDLPEQLKDVFLVDKDNDIYIGSWHETFYEEREWLSDGGYSIEFSDIIAWRELKPFEEDEA